MKKLLTILLILTLLLTLCACKPSDETPDVPPAEETDDGIFELDAEIIAAISDYLRKLHRLPLEDRGSISVVDVISKVQDGVNPVFLDFADGEEYFVAMYLDVENYETFPDPDVFTWVGFKGSDDILQYYGELTLSEVFQVDTASSYTNLLTGEAVEGKACIFLPYTNAKFVDGVNVNPPVSRFGGVVCLTPVIEDLYLLSTDLRMEGISCATIDKEAYLLQYRYYYSVNKDVKYMLGKYNTTFGEYVITGEGLKDSTGLDMTDYLLLKLDDFTRGLNEILERENNE